MTQSFDEEPKIEREGLSIDRNILGFVTEVAAFAIILFLVGAGYISNFVNAAVVVVALSILSYIIWMLVKTDDASS